MSLPVANLSLPLPLIVQTKQKVKRRFLKAKVYIMGQVNSLRRRNFKPAAPAPESSTKLSNKLALGAGCYWGTEKFVRSNFQKKFPCAIKSCTVGFMAPKEPDPQFKHPTYQQVCSGASGHIEVLYVELNEPEKHFEELIRFFFQFHDPTTPNRQGNDCGFQYASWIYCADAAQSAIAEKVREELQKAIDAGFATGYSKKRISTKITPLTDFTAASNDHQEYLAKNPNGYCNHRIRFQEWPDMNASEEEDTTK